MCLSLDRSDRPAADRAQSEVLGFVLLLGLSIAVVGATVAVGSIAYSSSTADAEVANVENAMSHLSSKTTLVALGSDTDRSFSFGSLSDGQMAVDDEQGELRLYHLENETAVDRANLTADNRFYDTTLGAIVYTSGDRRIALQGGGVWTLSNDRGTMVSPPEYHYRQTTLTFPIVRITGEGASTGSPAGSITESGRDPIADAPANPIDNGTVVVEIRSDYYEGWYEFLDSRAAGSATIDHENRTVFADLTHPSTIDVAGQGAIYSSVAGQHPTVRNADVHLGSPAVLPPIQPTIDRQVADAAEEETASDPVLDGESLEEGRYYFDESVTVTERTEIDPSDGNVTIVIDGDLILEDELYVDVDGLDDDAHVEYFINGSLEGQGSDAGIITEPEIEPWRNLVFVGGNAFGNDAGTFGDMHALIYAPEATPDLTGGGNSEIHGSFVAKDFMAEGNQINVDIINEPYAEELDRVSYTPLSVPDPPAPITYLHVSENTVQVETD